MKPFHNIAEKEPLNYGIGNFELGKKPHVCCRNSNSISAVPSSWISIFLFPVIARLVYGTWKTSSTFCLTRTSKLLVIKLVCSGNLKYIPDKYGSTRCCFTVNSTNDLYCQGYAREETRIAGLQRWYRISKPNGSSFTFSNLYINFKCIYRFVCVRERPCVRVCSRGHNQGIVYVSMLGWVSWFGVICSVSIPKFDFFMAHARWIKKMCNFWYI